MTIETRIYRCARQDEMYLYLRADLQPQALPPELLQRLGRLSEVMSLTLTAQRKLARVDVEVVIARLGSEGWFLQLPPDGQIKAHLHEGD